MKGEGEGLKGEGLGGEGEGLKGEGLGGEGQLNFVLLAYVAGTER